MRRSTFRSLLAAIALVAVHLAVSVGAFLWSFKLQSKHFDGKHVSSISVFIAQGLEATFWFPFARPLMEAFGAFPSILGLLPLLLNSAFVAAAIVLAVHAVRRKG